MLEKILGRKIELMPKEPNENQILCEKCGGTGWMLKDEKWIEQCIHCYHGLIEICPTCQQPYKKRYSHNCDNPECRSMEQRKRDIKVADEEVRRFEKAVKVSYDDCPSENKIMMFSERYGYNEGYFSELEDLIECVKSEDATIPEYVWATSKIHLTMDTDSIIENACSDLHENARDNISNEKELQDFLNKWCEKQHGVDTYYVDYGMAILVPDDYRKENSI